MTDRTKTKNSSAAYALLLATSPAWATSKTGDGAPPQNKDPSSKEQTSSPAAPMAPKGSPRLVGGKNQEVRISSIVLEKEDEKKAQQCHVPAHLTRTKKPKPQSIFSLAIDPKQKQVISLQFTISNIPPSSDDRVLVLLYSQCLSKYPFFKTTKSKNKLALLLDKNNIQHLGTYPIGRTQTTPQMTFKIDLATESLTEQVEAGNHSFYFQAGLLNQIDFNNRNYDNVILSELESVHFSLKACLTEQQLASVINMDNAVCAQMPGKSQ